MIVNIFYRILINYYDKIIKFLSTSYIKKFVYIIIKIFVLSKMLISEFICFISLIKTTYMNIFFYYHINIYLCNVCNTLCNI